MHNSIWSQHSSYNLGVAITAIAIIVAFIELILNRKELKFKLNYQKRRIALLLTGASIIFVLLGELNGFFSGYPFAFEISGAILMIIAIIIYLDVILNPIKQLTQKQISILQDILAQTLSNSYLNKSQTIKGCIELFKSLLKLSLENKEVQKIFKNDFASDVFLNHFSESYFIFSHTIDFYIEKKNGGKYNLNYIEIFLERLMIKSLENNESFLNIFIRQEVYPEALFCLDEIMLTEKDNRVLDVLFGGNRFSRLIASHGLNNIGQLNYVNLIGRHFELVCQKNNYGCQKNYNLNDDLIIIFFEKIERFFESSFDQKHLEALLDKVEGFSWHYRWSLKTEDKSEKLRKKTGEFLYNIFYQFISKHRIIEDEGVFRLKVHQLCDHFLEIQENGIKNNIAYNIFIERLKGTIIGTENKECSLDREIDKYSPNYKGYFPAMILIYFYAFGFDIFSKNRNELQDKKLHIPILSKLAESFPRLYQGFKQEFYDAKSLPDNKKDLLEKQGKEILNKFLKKNMVYNFEENSLSYYYTGNIHSSKIFLDKVKNEQIIKVEKL